MLLGVKPEPEPEPEPELEPVLVTEDNSFYPIYSTALCIAVLTLLVNIYNQTQ